MRKPKLDGAVRVTVAFAAGLWLGIVMAYRIVPTDEQLWAFAGASLGAVIAIGGAALLFVFQRDLVVRSELAAVDELLKQFEAVIGKAAIAANCDDEKTARSLLSIGVDKLASLNKIFDRSTATHLGLIHTATSIDILNITDLRRATETESVDWTDFMGPRLQFLAAATKIIRDALWNPALRADVPDAPIKLPF